MDIENSNPNATNAEANPTAADGQLDKAKEGDEQAEGEEYGDYYDEEDDENLTEE